MSRSHNVPPTTHIYGVNKTHVGISLLSIQCREVQQGSVLRFPFLSPNPKSPNFILRNHTVLKCVCIRLK